MKNEEIKASIAAYQKLVSTQSPILSDLFAQADLSIVDGNAFGTLPLTQLFMYLGVKDNKLVGFLSNEKSTSWSDKSQVFTYEFSSFTSVIYQALKDQYQDSRVVSSYGLSFVEAFARIDAWRSSKNDWFTRVSRANTIVEYFEIPGQDFANDKLNVFAFGLAKDKPNRDVFDIDLIAANPEGLFDMSRPVPPYSV